MEKIIEQTLSYTNADMSNLKELQALAIKCYAPYADTFSSEHAATLLANLNDESRTKDLINLSQVFVCKAGKKIIGVAYFIPHGNPTPMFDASWCYIKMVGVDPQFRGKGIARQLTQTCINHAIQTKENIIALHTSEFMNAARHIYESLGFTVYKEIDPIFNKKYWVYVKKLK